MIAVRTPVVRGLFLIAMIQWPHWGQADESLFSQAVGPGLSPSEAVENISSSNTGITSRSGINVNDFLGADRFYAAGYDGAGAVLGNIEAQHSFNGHESLQHVTTRVTGTGAVGSVGSHSTSVTHSMAGRLSSGSLGASNYYAFGMAYGAEVWSGAIATGVNGNSFNVTDASTASVYSAMLKTGVGGQTVDVFNSSWGFTDPTGWNRLAVGVDGLINDTGVVAVVSAGNDGPGQNTVGGIGAGYNSITVGALGTDTAANPYTSVSSFSSRGPNDFFDVQNNVTISRVRAAVDIVAPGQNLTLATTNSSTAYGTNQAGTSFAAPIVAGGAGLIVDAGKDLYGTTAAIDGRVVKAVLLNSADKLPGWSNALAANGSGVLTTTQALDYNQGAGRMNLDQAFDQYVSTAHGGLAGTTDVSGMGHGDLGLVSTVGWDFGEVARLGSNTYFMNQQLQAGSTLDVTLTWFADMISGSDADFSGAGANHLANLDLTVFQFNNLNDRSIISTIAQSVSLYNVVEHLSFALANSGFYGFTVNYAGAHWDFGAVENGETYGLSWSGVGIITAVPEPSSLALVGCTALVLTWRRRRVG